MVDRINSEVALERARSRGFLPGKLDASEESKRASTPKVEVDEETRHFAISLALAALEEQDQAAVIGKQGKGKETRQASTETKVEEKQAPLNEKQKTEKSGKADPQPVSDNIYSFLFLVLMVALNSKEDSVKTDTDILQADNTSQLNWNNLNNAIAVQTLPPNPTVAQVAIVQAANEAATALKGDIQSELVTLRQGSQLDMTNTNADVDAMQQDTSMDSDWLQTLSAISQVINQMNQRTF